MSLPIDGDLERFQKIVRGKVRDNLKEYLTHDKIFSQQGKRGIVVPIPHIQLPYIRYGGPGKGVGQGEGEKGDELGPGDFGEGDGGAGTEPGHHYYEAEISLDELADILGEALELPRIQPKKKHNVEGWVERYTSVRRVGPESLRYMRRTMKEALKRAIASGEYNPDDPMLVPIKDDKRYRSWKQYPSPDSNALVFLLRDYSGSMGYNKKRLVRIITFWLDVWLRKHYRNVVVVYIGHDTQASVLSADDFFHATIGGGTMISSAYQLVSRLIHGYYDPSSWNLYAFHFTDGENFGYDDEDALGYLMKDLIPVVNLFGYCQVLPTYTIDSTFLRTIQRAYDERLPENLVLYQIDDDDQIFDGLKKFLGKGK